MRTSLTLLIFAPLFFLAPVFAHAQIIISEIMYDLAEGSDTGREWIEVFNAGTELVDLTEWRLFEGTSNHGITAVGDATLAAGEYAIIADNSAKFSIDWPNVSAVFDSAFSLNNTGETLKMRCCGDEPADKDSVTYTSENGGAGDGNSLARNTSGTFVGAAPTPGTGSLTGGTHANESVTPSKFPESDPEPASTSSSSATKQAVEPQITAYAGKDRIVFVGADSVFEGTALNSKKEPIDGVRFVWNFGDGTTAEGETVLHHWSYPGKYVLVLDIAQNKKAASHRITVEAVMPELSLLILDDGGVGIENASSRDIDLSLWYLKEQTYSFMIPENTFVLKGSILKLATGTLGFGASELTELHYPNGVRALGAGESFLEPSEVPEPEIVEVPVQHLETARASEPVSEPEKIEDEIVLEVPEVRISPQVAAVVESVPDDAFAPWIWWVGALVIALAGGAGAFFVRRIQRNEWDIGEMQ